MTSEPFQDASLDWLCIPIAKKDESDKYCDYIFSAALHAADPNQPGRSKVVGQERGLLRITKATGEISVIQPMPGDNGSRRAQRAARIVLRHWKRGEYPKDTIYAAG